MNHREGLIEDDGVSYNQVFLAKLVVMASIGGFLFGYDTGIVSGAVLYLHDDFPDITEVQKEFVVSLALAGSFIASLIAGPM